jgi:hypothetical protein
MGRQASRQQGSARARLRPAREQFEILSLRSKPPKINFFRNKLINPPTTLCITLFFHYSISNLELFA